ncbi:MAG TPA: alkaline phosphatase, partial [Solirubrobacteraceae bacterium]|nr:alkaline phosphatase [Solirubrobacteraceae bacterium]
MRTYDGAVGVDVDRSSVPTLLERARAAGKATGLVTAAQVTDASPAAFGAHVPDRGDQSEIARPYLEESRPDVILRGGEKLLGRQGLLLFVGEEAIDEMAHRNSEIHDRIPEAMGSGVAEPAPDGGDQPLERGLEVDGQPEAAGGLEGHEAVERAAHGADGVDRGVALEAPSAHHGQHDGEHLLPRGGVLAVAGRGGAERRRVAAGMRPG